MLRSVQGTWLGITKGGRIAILTNFREEGPVVQEARSRGELVNTFLTQPAHSAIDSEKFAKSLIGEGGEGLRGVGGFTLIYGQVGMPLAVLSNRARNVEDISRVIGQKDEVVGLSNASFNDRSWPKVLKGEELMRAAIRKSVARKDTKLEFIEEMMNLLSVNNMPSRKPKESWESYSKKLRQSIFIPVMGGEGTDDDTNTNDTNDNHDLTTCNHKETNNHLESPSKSTEMSAFSGLYGTQTQTVILVDHSGHVTFVERRLYNSSARAIEKGEDRDRTFEFQIEPWE